MSRAGGIPGVHGGEDVKSLDAAAEGAGEDVNPERDDAPPGDARPDGIPEHPERTTR